MTLLIIIPRIDCLVPRARLGFRAILGHAPIVNYMLNAKTPGADRYTLPHTTISTMEESCFATKWLGSWWKAWSRCHKICYASYHLFCRDSSPCRRF